MTKWERSMGRTADLLADSDDPTALRQQRNEILHLLDEVEDASNRVLEIAPKEEIRFDMMKRQTDELRMELNARIKAILGHDTSSMASKRTTVKSRRSVQSTRSLQLEEEAKAAAIQVKLKYHQTEVEMATLKIEKEKEKVRERTEKKAAEAKLELQKELEIAEARLQVLKEEDESQDLGSNVPSEAEDSQTKVKRFLESFQDVPKSATTTTATTTVLSAVCSGRTTNVVDSVQLSTKNDLFPDQMIPQGTSDFFSKTQGSYHTQLNPHATPFYGVSKSERDLQTIGYRPPIMSTGFAPSKFPTYHSAPKGVAETSTMIDPEMYRLPRSFYQDNPSNLPNTSRGADCQLSTSLLDRTTGQGYETMVKLMSKPLPDIEKFDGNALMYRRFVRQFTNYVGAYCENDSERLTYLEQYTTGEAHRVVKGYSNEGASKGYAAAMEELDQRYGNEDSIACAYV